MVVLHAVPQVAGGMGKNGIPLCRFHHMQLHNSGWTIRADRGPHGDSPPRYWVTPGPNHPDPIELHPRYSTAA